jgi:hypothetical protein
MNHDPLKGCVCCHKFKPLSEMRKVRRGKTNGWRCVECLQRAKERKNV